ncbi:hypothetical protein M427DRAFT_342394 [Gonapodya prolifera JEL478]|uniref:Transmembrane protein n=1 Tax=Gonapodya prolifera (strain JEL478) TaxID=1344416 RepID=A0A139ACJ7_GONPJ|nr:hypothetical protein M427DRAFT_342394 [Gonapodya prolifera JEL478]|eukprot:KXS14490.1 hypothetical protein M427DRAFT_342394 [Gonapodya prolifera JEL478]
MGGAFRISRGDSVGAGRETRLRAGIAIALSALGGVNAQTDNTQQPDDIILRIGALSLTRTWTIVFFSVAGALLALILLAIVYFVFFARSSRPHSPSKRTSKTPQNDDDDDTPIAEMQMSGSSVNLLANVPKPGTTDAPVLPITVDPPSSSSATTKPADSPPTALPHNRTVSSTKPPPTPMAPTPVVVDAIPELHEAPDPSKAHGLARFQSQHAKTLVAGTGGSPVSASSLPGSATGSMAPAHGLVDDGFADATLVAGAGAGGGQGTTTAPMASPTTALMSPLLGDLGHSHPDSNAPAPAPAATPTTTLAQAPNISLASSHSPTSPSAHQTTPKSTSSSTRAALHILPTPATPPPDAGGVHLGTSTPTPALETPASLMQTPLALRDPRPFSPRVGLSPARLRVTVRAMLRHHSSLVKSGGAEGDGAGEVFKVARELGVVAGLSKEVLRAASAPRGRKIGVFGVGCWGWVCERGWLGCGASYCVGGGIAESSGQRESNTSLELHKMLT